MEKTASFDTEDSERCLQIRTYDERVLVDDEFTKHVDSLCTDHAVRPVVTDGVAEPYIGMEFGSREGARECYVVYGRNTGFTVRTHHNRRSRINNTVIGQDFVCSKEGFREKKYACRKDRVLPAPPVTREGCPAMLRVALRDGEKWAVTKFVEEHNHTLMSPSKVPLRGPGKNLISEDEKDRRIRELTLELSNERQRCKRQCAAYEERLRVLVKDIEQHTCHLSKTVQDIVHNIKELEKKIYSPE